MLVASFFVQGGAFGGAWTIYPPLSAKSQYNLTPLGSSIFLVAVALEFVAFLLGGINFVTTAMNSRAPGMKFYDMPIVVWMIVIASILFMASVGPLIAGAIMLFMDQQLGTAFFDPNRGGDPMLWQHLFWFFGHPEVYVVLLPAIGIVAEIITVFSRKKLFAYKTVLYTTFGTGVLSFTVWAHHQFIAGIDPRMANIFTVTTLLISVPIAEMCFVYIATLYGGSITLATPMLWALAFIGEFLIGGVTGHLPRRERLGHLPARHLLRAGALPLHVRADRHHRHLRRRHLLVPEDVREDDERHAGQDALLDHDHRLQLRSSSRSSSRARPATTGASTAIELFPELARPGSRTCASSRPARWS